MILQINFHVPFRVSRVFTVVQLSMLMSVRAQVLDFNEFAAIVKAIDSTILEDDVSVACM